MKTPLQQSQEVLAALETAELAISTAVHLTLESPEEESALYRLRAAIPDMQALVDYFTKQSELPAVRAAHEPRDDGARWIRSEARAGIAKLYSDASDSKPPANADNIGELVEALAIITAKLQSAKKNPVILSWDDAETIKAALAKHQKGGAE